MKKNHILLLITLLLTTEYTIQAQDVVRKPRIIITADPELDDLNSLIRFLLYSPDFKIEGLIYASSQFHWKGDGKGTKFMVPGREYTRYGLNLCPCESYRWNKDERFIHDAVEAYEKVYKNLVIHNPSYPSPEYLKSKIRFGNIEFEGDISKDSEGSDLIKAVLMDNIPGPVYVTAWGGQSTLARALKSIEDEYQKSKNYPEIRKKIFNKLVILASGDQDNTYESYIKPNWSRVDYRLFKAGPNYGYGAQLVASNESKPFLTSEWMKENISSKGPLGSLYRVWGDGKQSVKGDRFDYFGLDGYTNEQLKQMGYIVWMPIQTKGSWLGEGDTFTFMNILNNGLGASNKEYPGGWSGRTLKPEAAPTYNPFSNDTSKVKDLVISDSTLRRNTEKKADEAAFPNFFPAAQNDFAVRMQWSVTDKFKDANHAPKITIHIAKQIVTKPGKTIKLDASVIDPDGDSYTVRWWQFSSNISEPQLVIKQDNSLKTFVTIPSGAAKNQKLYLVLEVTDNAAHRLTSYKTIQLIL
ncbi:MAG: DUF1593 domain-containing protein [Chitinophagaceae bacterium]|nr:DUF1593 domain-containing protein [Chitinophagaceae bacterium]